MEEREKFFNKIDKVHKFVLDKVDELIVACENMIGGYNGLADDECYI